MTGQRLPKVDFTEHSPGAPHHGTSTGEISCNSSTRGYTASTGEEAWRSTKSEAIGGGGFREGTPSRSPRRGSFRRSQLEELEEEVEATILSKHQWRRSPELAGVARRRRRWSRSPAGSRGREENEWGLGWVGWPTQTWAGWLSRAEWAGWASRPVGPAR
jgi:hypothetical protein